MSVEMRRLPPESIQSHAHANKALGDGAYIAYVLIQMFKLGIALIGRRWPELR
jgi:hypothetical protein